MDVDLEHDMFEKQASKYCEESSTGTVEDMLSAVQITNVNHTGDCVMATGEDSRAGVFAIAIKNLIACDHATLPVV